MKSDEDDDDEDDRNKIKVGKKRSLINLRSRAPPKIKNPVKL